VWSEARRRVARALVVATLVTPAVVLAHLLTRGELPGLTGLSAVVGLVGLVSFAAPLSGTGRLAAAVVLAQVAGHGALAALTPGGAQSGCLPAVGRGAEAGLQLAMLRADAVCAPGTLAAGPTLTALLGAAVTAVALVAGQVLVGAVAARLVTAAEAGVAGLRAVARAALPTLPRATPALPVPPRRTAVTRSVPVPVAPHSAPEPLTRRGPPVLAPV